MRACKSEIESKFERAREIKRAHVDECIVENVKIRFSILTFG